MVSTSNSSLYLSELLDLLFASTDVAVRHVRLLLDLHHRHGRVDLGRERDVDLVFVAVDADAHPLFDVGRSNLGKNQSFHSQNLTSEWHLVPCDRWKTIELLSTSYLQIPSFNSWRPWSG